jgi:hypothetical protein
MNHPIEDLTIGSVHEWLTLAIQDVSETMFGQAFSVADSTGEEALSGQVLVACIGIRGNCQLEVALYFPQELARNLTSLMLGMPAAELDDQMTEDVAGEFSNMVVGAVKSRISDLGVACAMTVPRVVHCALNSPESDRKIQASLAVIRGSAGPRPEGAADAHHSLFRVGDGLVRADLYL